MLVIMISGILWSSAVGYRPARAQAPEAAAETRAAVQRLGAGTKTRVEVRLQDGTRLRGHITAAGEDTFTITDSKTGAPRAVAYADAARVKKSGGGRGCSHRRGDGHPARPVRRRRGVLIEFVPGQHPHRPRPLTHTHRHKGVNLIHARAYPPAPAGRVL